MADEVLFAGGRLDSLSITAGTPTESSSTSFRETAYADASVVTPSTSSATVRATFRDSSFAATDVVTGERVYAHFDTGNAGAPGTTIRTLAALVDSSGFPWLAIRGTGTSGRAGLYYNSGTGASPTWTLLGSDFAIAAGSGTRYTFDIMLTLGSPHTVTLMQDNATTLVGAATFTQASLTSLRHLDLASWSSSFDQSFSQILITRGIPTFGAKVRYARATGAGSNSGWTGAATNVNEAVNSDTTFDSTTTAGVKQTYAMGDVTVPAGFEIKSVFNFVRAKNDGTAPNNIKSVIRSGGTDYSSANLSGIGLTFASLGMRYDTDPATSAAWTQTGWNAAEAGYESAT